MKKSFSSRRTARRIGQDDDGEEDDQSRGPVVKRPSSSKSKSKSSSRLSFGVGDGSSLDDEDKAAFTPKKSSLSRLAVERKASEHLPFRAELDADRPSYSKHSLNELRQSTPSTPKDDEVVEKSLDIAAKFGPLARLDVTRNSAIPTDAEIREKKERRARLAKEQEYISLHGDEDDEETSRDLLLRDKDDYPETRLVPEDEDIAEGFDEFVEDGKISLGKKAERDQQRQRRTEMAEMIAEAEGGAGSDDESEDSDADRNAAFEAAQTRSGAYGGSDSASKRNEMRRPKTPPRIVPIPDMVQVLERLKGALRAMEESHSASQKKLEDLAKEKADLVESEVWIQSQLKEAGERYEKLRLETGMAGTQGIDMAQNGGKLHVHRGLDSLGTPSSASPYEAEDD